jgi:hypothetical protein
VYRVGFIMEQGGGHTTHTKNLQDTVGVDPSVQAYWRPIQQETRGFVSKIPVYSVRLGVPARRAVAELDRQVQLDAAYFHTWVPALFLQRWMKRVPSILSLDATPSQWLSLNKPFSRVPSDSWPERIKSRSSLQHLKWMTSYATLRTAHRLVAWSDWVKSRLLREYQLPEDKIVVIPPGVNTSVWHRSTQRSSSSGPTRILFVGGDLERKGGLLLLEAFRALRPLNVELHLVTWDAVPQEPGLFVHNQMQPNSDALKRLFHDSDIFCLPTSADCSPWVLLEASAAGLPVVASRVAAIPEMIVDGKTGLLVPSGDARALTGALTRLIADRTLRLSLGERAAEVAGQRFDSQHTTRQLLDLIKQSVDETKASTAFVARRQNLARRWASY